MTSQVLRVALAASVLFGSSGSIEAQIISLDPFEAAAIRVVQPLETEPQFRYLWNQYEGDFTEGPDPGTESISTATSHDGTRSLRVEITDGNLYLQFYPHNGSYWQWMRDFVNGTWQLNTYNRLRFWIKVPPTTDEFPPGQGNLQFGTYFRASDGSKTSAEDGGGHFYHHFNIPYTGEWHQIIVDSHPNHSRGGSGATEWGDQLHPTDEPNYNYFDLITRFYLDFQGDLFGYPSEFFVDGFEFYRETRPENIDQIYSLNGVYIQSSNTVMVRWMRHKDENSVNHEVRYAFEDIHRLGWVNATPAPNGTVVPPGGTGYNGMEWSSSSLNLLARPILYVAIKPQNSNLFRQIVIPLIPGTGLAPTRPTNVHIVAVP